MRYAPLFLLLIFVPFTAYAQGSGYGTLGLWADSTMTSCEVTSVAPFTPFMIYVFCEPPAGGMNCAEFGLDLPYGWIAGGMGINPDANISLGTLPEGVSVCFNGCWTDPVWVASLLVLSSNITPAYASIARHATTGEYQIASCPPDVHVEPVFAQPKLAFNAACVSDETEPGLESVAVIDDEYITLRFDEPVFELDAETASNYTVYPEASPADSVSVVWAQLKSDEESVEMRLGARLEVGLYVLAVDNVRDVAGNAIGAGGQPPKTIVFTGTDTTPPRLLNAYAPDSVSVVLAYSEQMLMSAQVVHNYRIEPRGGGAQIPVASAVLQQGGLSCTLSLGGPLLPEVIYEVTVQNVTDLAGNPLETGYDVRYFKAPDHWPPYITGIVPLQYSGLKVSFNEALDIPSALDAGNYSVLRVDPAGSTISIVDAVMIDDQTVRLVPDSVLVQGLYGLFASGVSDSSMNAMLPDTFMFAVADTTPPFLMGVEALAPSAVEATFSEPLDEASAENPALYSVYPAGNPAAPIPIDFVELLSDLRTARVHLIGFLESGSLYTLRVSGIEDVAGNPMGTQSADFSFDDGVPAWVASIALSDFSHIGIQFSERVYGGSDDVDNYLVYETPDSSLAVEIASVQISPTRLSAVLVTAAPLVALRSYSLQIRNILDGGGNACDPDTIYLFDAVETVPPHLESVSTVSDSVVLLEFSEPLDPVVDGAVERFWVFEYDDPPSILPLASATLEPSQTTVRLLTSVKGYVGLAYRAEFDSIPDISGNMVSGLSGPFYFVDDIPPVLLGAEAVTSERARARFSERIGSASPGHFLLFETGDSLQTIGVEAIGYSPDRTAVNLYLDGMMTNGAGYTLRVSGVEDEHGVPIAPGSEAQFIFLDLSGPELVSAQAVTSTHVNAVFNEPIDPATAADAGNYSIYPTGLPGEPVGIGSVVAGQSGVDLSLLEQLSPGVEYALRADGVEDLYGNPCVYQTATFTFVDYSQPGRIGLWADEFRGSNEVDVPPYTVFRIYFWVNGGSSGIHGVEYRLPYPQTYVMIGVTLNPFIAALELGEPFGGHAVSLTGCQFPWAWSHYIDCLMIDALEETVQILPHPETGLVQVSTCQAGYPLIVPELVSALYINGVPIATLLAGWDAAYRTGGVEVTWTLNDTGAVPEFSVVRLEGEGDAGQPVSGDLISRAGLAFTLFDSSIEYGRTYRYRVEYEDAGEHRSLFETGPVETPLLPLTLRQNRPNPFNPSTEISFFLPSPGDVRLDVYDVQGRHVRCLVEGSRGAGEHTVSWDGLDRTGRAVDSGVYFYRLMTGKEQISRKMVLLR